MEIQEVEGLPDATFRRLTGVRKRTFIEMMSVLHPAEAHRKVRGGKPNMHRSGSTSAVVVGEFPRSLGTA